MKNTVQRFDFEKNIICIGVLELIDNGKSTTLIYTDEFIKVKATELYHPVATLSSLRKILENEHKSILGIEGCRIDVTYRHTGHFGQYIMEKNKPATIRVNMFDPTTETDKICLEKDQKKAYSDWFGDLVN
jgi:hypothetical protein